jgi:hypothetical protein
MNAGDWIEACPFVRQNTRPPPSTKPGLTNSTGGCPTGVTAPEISQPAAGTRGRLGRSGTSNRTKPIDALPSQHRKSAFMVDPRFGWSSPD